MPERPPPPAECAQCGSALPRTARACPSCGADERTGWRESSPYDGLDLPDHAFDDEESDDRRGAAPPVLVNGVAWYWWCVGAALLFLLIVGLTGRW